MCLNNKFRCFLCQESLKKNLKKRRGHEKFADRQAGGCAPFLAMPTVVPFAVGSSGYQPGQGFICQA